MTFKQSISSFVVLYLFALLIVTAGCGGAKDPRHKDLVPASGTVFYKGEPVDGATLIFHNEDSSKQGGSTMSEADGTFALRTFGGLGTYPGSYTVTVSKDKVTYPISEEEMSRREMAGEDIPPPKVESLLPKKYRGASTSDIKISIPAGGDKSLKIELAD